jgi:hypothetical protein
VSAPPDPFRKLTPKQVFCACIWLSRECVYTKILLLCVARFFKGDTLKSSSMSYQQVARDCSMSERKAMRAAQQIIGRWLVIERGKGHRTGSGPTNLYHGIIPPEIASQLRAALGQRQEVSTRHPLRAENPKGVSTSHPMGCPPVTRTYYSTSDERGHTQPTNETSFPLARSWVLPREWREWTLATFNATSTAIDRAARKFHSLKASTPRTADGWLTAWRSWCHDERAFTPRTTRNVAPRASGDLPAETWRVHVDGFRRWKHWHPDLGPNPDQPGCRAPAEILASGNVGAAA